LDKYRLFATFSENMQLKFIRLILFILFISGLFIVSAEASVPVVHISPKPTWLNILKPYDKKIPLRDVDNGYFYQLYEEQVQVEKQADYTHVIRDIVSNEGIQNGSELNISFDPSYERIDFHELIVWRDNKPLDRLKAASFKVVADEKDLSRFIYQGSYSAYCILDDIRKGDKIEYSYTITGRNPIFGNKYFRDFYLQTSLPVAHIYKSILISPQRNINYKSFNKVPKVVISDKNGLKCYEWEDFQVKPADDYDNEPGWYNNYNYVQVSDYSNWQEVVDWGLKINPLSTNIKGELAAQITKLKTDSHGDKEVYFRNAVKMVQDEVRYMGIELGEYSHKANHPEKVYGQRYGDCKDKSLLLASILNADGIEAHMVLINSGVKGGIDQYLPSPNAFDHATVVATVNNKQVWVDATIANQRGTSTNIYFPNYGKGLILKPGNNVLTSIPLSKAGKIQCTETYNIPNENGKVSLDVKTIYTLNEADNIRDKFASASMAETEKNYLNYYAKTYPKIESKDSITVSDNEAKNELITYEHYLISDFFKKDTDTNKYGASFYANYINDQLLSIPNKVTGPVALNYPYNLDYTIVVTLPSNWNVENRSKEIKKDEYAFESSVKTSDSTLYLNYKLSYLKDFIPANKLDAYRQDAKQISDNELSYSFNYIPDVSKVPIKINYWLLLVSVVLVALMGITGVRLYRTETDGIVFTRGSGFVPIGGWLMLIALGLAATTVVVLVTLFSDGCFDLNKWSVKHFTISDVGYKALFVFQTLGNVILMCYACFCLILLLNKRDILPKFIIFFYAYGLAYAVAYYIFAMLVYHGNVSEDTTYTVVRAVIVAAIWIPYFKRSTRVQHTFIVPYPETNYSYEWGENGDEKLSAEEPQE